MNRKEMRSNYHCYSWATSLLLCLISSVTDGQMYCEVCSNGELPSEDCWELAEKAASTIARTPMCAEIQLELFQEGCCQNPPRERCTVCPDGRPFRGSVVVPNFDPNNGDMSCADLNSDHSYLDYLFESGRCDDTLLRRSGAWCGCPGVRRECSLCPNGDRPPKPNLVDPVYYGWDCDTFDFVSSFFSEAECNGLVNEIFEFDAPSFCGCKDSPIPRVCDLCPEGHIIARPDLLLGHNRRFSCRELALSTRYIPSRDTCEKAILTHRSNGYVSACCAPIDQVPRMNGGTASSPTVHSSSQMSTILIVGVASLCLIWS